MSLRAWLIHLLFGDDMSAATELKAQVSALSGVVVQLMDVVRLLQAKQTDPADIAALAEAAVEAEATMDRAAAFIASLPQ
jgi:hypothetical protein